MSFFNYLLNRNLAHVKRFNNRPLHFPESVAEHSYYVAHYTQLICWVLEQKGTRVDSKKAMSMALIHDSEEGFSGDILNPFKHFNAKVSAAIAEVNEETIGMMFEELPKEAATELIDLWHEEQSRQTIEAEIVKVADSLSLVSKCFEEIEAGNSYFREIYKNQLQNLKKLDFPWWQNINKDLLAGAENEV